MSEIFNYPAPASDIEPGMGDRLLAIRAKLNCSQCEMDELLTIVNGTWWRYESGGQIPGGNVLAALAREGFNINWLLTGEGKMEAGRGPIGGPLAERAWVNGMKADGHAFVRYSCPNGDCNRDIEALLPPEGEVYDTFVICSHCQVQHYRMVDHKARLHLSLPGASRPVRVATAGGN